jgi:uncharacterized protein YjbJ (UPF0337 family)
MNRRNFDQLNVRQPLIRLLVIPATEGTLQGEKMDKDRVEGAGTNIKGKIKEGVGKMTGDAKTEAEGQADQVKGKAQNAVGGAKDKAREVLNGE